MLPEIRVKELRTLVPLLFLLGCGRTAPTPVAIAPKPPQPVVLDVTALPSPPTLAVLDFIDLGPAVELAVLRKGLAEMLAGDLSAYQGLDVVERGRVEHVLAETDLGRGGLVEEKTVQRAGRERQADLLLSGSIAGSEGKVTVKAVLRRVGTDAPLAEWTLAAPTAKFLELERDLSERVRSALGLGRAAPRPPPAARPGPSPTVAVLGFADLSPTTRLRAMEAGFSEILQASLGGLKDVRLVERSKLDEVLLEQKLTLSGLVDADKALVIGRLLGAERLIYGSFFVIGNDFRVEARLVDTATAAVLRNEAAQGPSDRFGDLLGNLALRLARDLAITPPDDAARLVRAATPTRQLEAALYFVTGEEAYRHGRFADSALNNERILLLEPDNIVAHTLRARAWFGAGDYPKAIDAARQGLNRKFTPEEALWRDALQRWLADAYYVSGQNQPALEFLERQIAADPHGPSANRFRMRLAATLTNLNRHQEAIALLQKFIAEEKKSGDASSYAVALRSCFVQILIYLQRSPTSKRDAALAADILELMMTTAEHHRTPDWNDWAPEMPQAIEGITYLDERRMVQPFLSAEQKANYHRRTLNAFADLPETCWATRQALAKDLAELGRWKEAREQYLFVAAHPDDGPRGWYPSPWEMNHIQRTHPLSQVIEARFEAAAILDDHLADKPGAVEEYQAMVQEFGVTHQKCVQLVQELQAHGRPFEIPKKSALIVGGATDAWGAWRRVLGPLGYVVHPADYERLNAADLAPYELVVAVRQGIIPWRPAEALAFRSYVATGGSLLIVVSPGLTLSQPGLSNTMLSFFGVHARQEPLPARVESTELTAHPITRGISTVKANNAVALDVPAGASIVKAGDHTVLAARAYGAGRVVVAALGQWFLPSTDGLGEWWKRCYEFFQGRPIDQLPLDSGEGLQTPLLKNVLNWLAEPAANHANGRALPDDVLAIQRASLDVQLRTRPRDDLPKLLGAFVAATDSPRREEALLIAGEAILPMQRFPRKFDIQYTWPSELGPPRLDPRHFEELLRSYPDSSMRPYVQWEVAEIARLNRVLEFDTPQLYMAVDASGLVQGLSAGFEKVEAPKGSYAWAWANIRLAMIALQQEQPAKASEHARPVIDLMDQGPEKTLGLFIAGLSAEGLGKPEDATRYYEFIKASPPFLFPSDREDDAWAPLHRDPRGRRFHYWKESTPTVLAYWARLKGGAGP